jgi:hypothetical protein
MPDIPLNLQTLYADLVQDVHGRIAKPASVYRRTLRNIEFLYAKKRVGVVRRDIFIGRADDSEAQATAKTMQMEMERAEARRVTIIALKAAGMPTPFAEIARVLDALDDAGLLTKIIIVGTAAYQCYPPMIGSTLPRATIMSQDVDIATMSLAIKSDGEAESLEDILKRADPSFTGRMGLRPADLPSSFRSANGFTVDLLTPILRRDDPNPMPLQNLRAGAVPLQHLKWLIENPVPIAVLYGSAIPAFVPQPARYAVHKLIIAQKRLVNPQKRQKDLAQAKALIDVLRLRDPYALSDARDAAFAEGFEGWQVPIERSLSELKLDAEFEAV